MALPKIFDVFISHSSVNKDSVRDLVYRLRSEGIKVWFDEDEIGPGDRIAAKIEHGLSTSRYVVVVLSRASVKSKWVGAEYESFIIKEINQSVTRVIPVLLEPIPEEDIPPLLFSKKYVDISRTDEFEKFVARVNRPTISEYCGRLSQKPIVSGRLFNGNYHIEPADLLRVVLREVEFRSGDPIRATRINESLTLTEFAQELMDAAFARPVSAAVLLGEAGVGKTTTCKWLCQLLAEAWLSKRIVPVYIPLGDLEIDDDFKAVLDRQTEGIAFSNLAQDIQSEAGRLVFFLDGLNELPPRTLEMVLAASQQVARHHNAAVVLTSRPVAAVDTFWQGGEARFFEIQRWTENQLEQYFEKNKRSFILANMPLEVRHCLRLPLLAFLIIRRLGQDEPLPSLHTVADVFTYVLNQFLSADEEIQKSRAIPDEREGLKGQYKVCLQELAYRMTKDKVVQTEGESLERVLPEDDKRLFKPFMAHLVNSGLLRCSNATIAVDPQASIDELRLLKIGFLHQAFQEYLTAQQLLLPFSPQLPPDVSHDAFWREVPVYMIQSYSSVEQQKNFALNFLADKPDYLTSARLASEISDPGVRKLVRGEVVTQLLSNISTAGLYPYAIEAFVTLGDIGRDALRDCLRDQAALTNVFAKFEAHLIRRSIKKADEVAWRPLGRSVYLLGEMGDFWLAEYLTDHLSSVCSLHLLYHVGEALLTLTRKFSFQEKERDKLRAAALTLIALRRGDPVTRAYACATLRECGDHHDQQNTVASELQNFLSRKAAMKKTHFQDEFWQRAHGAEAFAEIADLSKCVEVLSHLFAVEERADYAGHEEVGYRLVQSSILKATLRSCDLSSGQVTDWSPFLESVFTSQRIAENGWACRHLERLLLTWFRTPGHLTWIKRWKDSGSLGGQEITNVLSNVIWLSS